MCIRRRFVYYLGIQHPVMVVAVAIVADGTDKLFIEYGNEIGVYVHVGIGAAQQAAHAFIVHSWVLLPLMISRVRKGDFW